MPRAYRYRPVAGVAAPFAIRLRSLTNSRAPACERRRLSRFLLTALLVIRALTKPPLVQRLSSAPPLPLLAARALSVNWNSSPTPMWGRGRAQSQLSQRLRVSVGRKITTAAPTDRTARSPPRCHFAIEMALPICLHCSCPSVPEQAMSASAALTSASAGKRVASGEVRHLWCLADFVIGRPVLSERKGPAERHHRRWRRSFSWPCSAPCLTAALRRLTACAVGCRLTMKLS